MAQETNETKAKEIQFKDPCQVWIGGCPNVYAAATKTSRASYEEVRQACIDMSKWQ